MSTFLNKLAGQNLTPSEAIRPRVPAIYEPYRRDRVPQWADGATRERDDRDLERDEIAVEPGMEPRIEPTNIRTAEYLPEKRQEQEVLGRLPTSRHSEITDSKQHEKHHANEKLGQQLSARATAERKHGEPPSELSESRAISAMVRRPQADRLVESERGRRVDTNGATSGAVLRRLRSTERAATVESRGDAVTQSSLAPDRPISSSLIREPRVAPTFNAKTTATSGDAALSAIHAGELANDVAAFQPRGAESAMPPVNMPERNPSPQFMLPRITPAIPNQNSQAIEIPTARGTANQATDSEPAMHVTIGRVEVRAVFPAPLQRRAQPAKPRPSLSLDNYLNRNTNRNANRNPGPR